jgi:trimethylamine:corrinoid methyltransferase-like protein
VLEIALGGSRPALRGPARLAARDPAFDLELGELGWLGLAWPAADVLELEGDRRRPSTLADLREATRLADALPQVGVVGAAVRALDVDPEARPLRELQTLLAGTTKHVQVEVPPDGRTAEALLEISRAAGAGSSDRPVVSALLDADEPNEPDRVRAATVLAGAGVPVGLVVHPAVGAPEEALGAALGRALRAAAELASRAPDATVFLAARAVRVGGAPAGADGSTLPS